MPRCLCPGSGRWYLSPPTGGPRGRSRIDAERREYPAPAGCGCGGCRARTPLGNTSGMMLWGAQIPDLDPTGHLPARGRRLTLEAAGHAESLPRGPGLGALRHPHPRQSRAAEPETGSAPWRGRTARGPLWGSASTAQSAESRREGPRAPAGGTAHLPTQRPTPPGGDRDPGAEQAGGPRAARRRAGSLVSHSAAGRWLSGSPCSATSPGRKLTLLCAEASASPPATPGRQGKEEESEVFPGSQLVLSASSGMPSGSSPQALARVERAPRECPQEGRVPSLAENFPVNHRLVFSLRLERGRVLRAERRLTCPEVSLGTARLQTRICQL